MAATRYGLDDVSGYDPVHLDTFSAYIRRSNNYVQSHRHFEWVRVPETAKLRKIGVRYYIAQPRRAASRTPRGVQKPARGDRRGQEGATPRAAEPRLRWPASGEDHGARAGPRRDPVPRCGGRPPRAGGSGISGLAGRGRRAPGEGGHPARDLPGGRPAGGADRVVWTFSPPRLIAGACISLAALLALAGVAATPWARRRWRTRRQA